MTSSNGNIFRVTGHLCGEFTGPRWIPHTKAVTRSFDVFFDLRLNKRLSKQSWGWWLETLSRPFWRHRNVLNRYGVNNLQSVRDTLSMEALSTHDVLVAPYGDIDLDQHCLR